MKILQNLSIVILLHITISLVFVTLIFVTIAILGYGTNWWWYCFLTILTAAGMFLAFKEKSLVQSKPKTFTLYSDPLFTKIEKGIEMFMEIGPSEFAVIPPYWNYAGEVGIESDINFTIPISLELKNAVISSTITIRLSVKTEPGFPSIHFSIDKDETKRQEQVQEIMGKLAVVVTAAHLQDKKWEEVKSEQVTIQSDIQKVIEASDGLIEKECNKLGVDLVSYALGDFTVSKDLAKAINFIGIAEENAKAIRKLTEGEGGLDPNDAARYLLIVNDEVQAYDVRGLENFSSLQMPGAQIKVPNQK